MAETKMQLVDWLDDLCVRFIVNLPSEELASAERIGFQIEEAQWFYEDFIRPLDPSLPSLNLRRFCDLIFQHCPLLAAHAELAATVYSHFLEYKTRVPVRGAIMLNDGMDEVVLVKGYKKGAKWSFPRGKINKDERDLDCAVREVYEETGFDIGAAGLVKDEKEMKYIDISMREQHMRLFVFRGVPKDTNFEPRTRKEISKIEWYNITDLPTQRKGQYDEQRSNQFYMVAPFLGPLKRWIKEQRKMDRTRVAFAQYIEPEAELDIVGELTAEEDMTATQDTPAEQEDPEKVDDMARLHALLARGAGVPPPLPAIAANATSGDEDALKAMLGLSLGGSTAPQQPMQQSAQQQNLLSLFTSKPANAASPLAHSNAKPPQTPFEQMIQTPTEVRSPHGQHHPRQSQSGNMPPPSFQFSPAQVAQAQQQFARQHPVPGQLPMVPNGQFATWGMAPPPAFGLPPQQMQHQQWSAPNSAPNVAHQAGFLQGHTAAQPNQHLTAQGPMFTKVHSMAAPKAANLPKPKFQQRQQTKPRNTAPATSIAHHTNAAVDPRDPFRRAVMAPAQPKAPKHTASQPLPVAAKESIPAQAPIPVVQQNIAPTPPLQSRAEHQQTLLGLFNGPSTSQHAQQAAPPVPVKTPIELPGEAVPRELPTDSPSQNVRPPTQLPTEAQGKLLDLFKTGSKPVEKSTSPAIQPRFEAPVASTPSPSGIQHRRTPSRKFRGGRGTPKASPKPPTPAYTILQRPQRSPRPISPAVRPPSVAVPVHHVKASMQMQEPKPFNPQILKRPAQLEDAANAPHSLFSPSSSEEMDDTETVPMQEKQRGLSGAAALSPNGAPAPVSVNEQRTNLLDLFNQPSRAASQMSQPPPPYQAQPNIPENKNALLSLFNNSPAHQTPPQVTNSAHSNHSNNLLNMFQSPAPATNTANTVPAPPFVGHAHNVLSPPNVPAQTQRAQHTPHSDHQNFLLGMLNAPKMPTPESHGTHGTGAQFSMRRTSAANREPAPTGPAFQPTQQAFPPALHTGLADMPISPPSASVATGPVSPLEKSRMPSLAGSLNLNNLPGISGAAGGERRGSGAADERRPSAVQNAGGSGANTPGGREFLLGFLENVAKGGK